MLTRLKIWRTSRYTLHLLHVQISLFISYWYLLPLEHFSLLPNNLTNLSIRGGSQEKTLWVPCFAGLQALIKLLVIHSKIKDSLVGVVCGKLEQKAISNPIISQQLDDFNLVRLERDHTSTSNHHPVNQITRGQFTITPLTPLKES